MVPTTGAAGVAGWLTYPSTTIWSKSPFRFFMLGRPGDTGPTATLTPLVEDPELPVLDYVGAFIDRFRGDVERRVKAAGLTQAGMPVPR